MKIFSYEFNGLSVAEGRRLGLEVETVKPMKGIEGGWGGRRGNRGDIDVTERKY